MRSSPDPRAPRAWPSLGVFLAPVVLLCAGPAFAQRAVPEVRVLSDADGGRLQVDGRDFFLHGMNWDYIPIGENYLYNFWTKPDEFIEAALEQEMTLLQGMGVNAIRVYSGIPPRWVRYIYERYGIATVINHPVARYGYTIDGAWIPNVDYADPRLREAVKADVTALVREFDGTPGVLFWLLGNENNYGLSWTSFEAEALPEGESDAARARQLYSLFNEIAVSIRTVDPHRPVAIANGDIQYLGVIAQECGNIDFLGTNVYRGISARDLFERVREELGKPVFFSEFGADAFDARAMREDQRTQTRFLLGQWQELYEQSSGKGREGNAIGGFLFQWSDGWWKFGQDSRLDVHDTNASWPNGGYPSDYVEGENNMNEEWWGICAKGRPDSRGHYELYPRAAYYALRRAFLLDPYGPATDLETIRRHFAGISPAMAVLEARGDRATSAAGAAERVRLTGVRMEIETYSTGGERISTPPAETPQAAFPSFLGFDHLESFYVDAGVAPASNVLGTLSLNVLGHVPLNPIDEIFYENRGRQRTLVDEEGEAVRLEGIERVKVYKAGVSWDDRWFRLDGFYRAGHTHWGYEGDFFGIYRDAYYGENVDIYNGEAPVGVELVGKKALDGFKLAFGPELYWGANPAILLKYSRQLGPVRATGIYQDEFAEQTTITTSTVIPLPPTQRATLHLATNRGPFGIELGGIWAGSTKIGETFQIAEERNGTIEILGDEVRGGDAWGAKGKLTYERGRWHWYGQASYAGIVADGGPTATTTFTGWLLKDAGQGNAVNGLTGLAVQVGDFQLSPNFFAQKPLVAPIPGDAPPPGRPRNVLDDPFAVRGSRETVAGEFLITHDPTPATWMWAWDNDTREDASLAWSLGFVLRHFPTTMDAAIGIETDGTPFPFPGAVPPADLWEVNARLLSGARADRRWVAHLFAGTGQPNGDDPRIIHRYGADGRFTWGSVAFATHAKINDWGPYDYHRDFNLTFPLQLMGDLSWNLGLPRWFGDPQSRFGVRGTWRSLDEFSPRYCPGKIMGPTGELICDPTLDGPDGSEWEIRTYLHVSI